MPTDSDRFGHLINAQSDIFIAEKTAIIIYSNETYKIHNVSDLAYRCNKTVGYIRQTNRLTCNGNAGNKINFDFQIKTYVRRSMSDETVKTYCFATRV